MAAPTPAPTDNSSLVRKVSVPIVAGAIVVLGVAGLDSASVHFLDPAPVQAAAIVVLTALGDIFLPARFLA